jgi:hypothetical protein
MKKAEHFNPKGKMFRLFHLPFDMRKEIKALPTIVGRAHDM